MVMSNEQLEKLQTAIQTYSAKYDNKQFAIVCNIIYEQYGNREIADALITNVLDSAEFVCGVTIRKDAYARIMSQYVDNSTAQFSDIAVHIRHFLRAFGWNSVDWRDYFNQ